MMMTYYTGFFICVVFVIVVVDGSPILSSIDQPTPFKYTIRIEKLEFGDELEDCKECEGDGAIVIGSQEGPEETDEKPDGSPSPDYPEVDDTMPKLCDLLKKGCGDEDYINEEFKDKPTEKKLFLTYCNNYEYICSGDDEPKIPDYPVEDQGPKVCKHLEETCGDEDYMDNTFINDLEAKKVFLLVCENYEYICGDNDDGESNDEDIYSESYEELFNHDDDDDDYYEDDEEEGGNEQEGDDDEENNETKRYKRAGGMLGTLKRRDALAHKKVTPKLKRTATKLHLLNKRERAPQILTNA